MPSSIFGKRIGDVREKGLADADSSDNFYSMLLKMKKLSKSGQKLRLIGHSHNCSVIVTGQNCNVIFSPAKLIFITSLILD